jgi:Carbohydrate family 9 binding domain-like
MKLGFALLVAGILAAADVPVIESIYSARDLPLTASPDAPHWHDVKPVVIESDFAGQPLSGHRTEVRSRWTDKHLLLLYVSQYKTLYVKPQPVTNSETSRLWNWDVAEAFIGSDFENIKKYKEFQVSPQGEWVDLDIDRTSGSKQVGEAWNSGFEVKARVDPDKKIWYGEMKIPFAAIDARKPAAGNDLRIGLFRIEGPAPNRVHVSWRSTDGKTFHMPERFGILRLQK